MMTYSVVFQDEGMQPLDGELLFLNAHGVVLGAAAVHPGGSAILDTDVPDGTILYHAAVPGYKPLTSSTLSETTTFTLAKEIPIVKYVLLGGIAVGAVVLLLSQRLKFSV